GVVLAEQEGAVAVHEVDRHTGGRQRSQPFAHEAPGVGRIVVAHPGLEQVAEDVQRVRAARLPVEERAEQPGDAGPLRVEVQVGNEQGRHRGIVRPRRRRAGGTAARRTARMAGHSTPPAAMTCRTRFAPSPTGYLHMGGVGSGLYCWLERRRWAGQFMLRIEDTDRERSARAASDCSLEAMDWLGLDSDEGP